MRKPKREKKPSATKVDAEAIERAAGEGMTEPDPKAEPVLEHDDDPDKLRR